jgi:arsenate reductase-like glutaredoxin family protein
MPVPSPEKETGDELQMNIQIFGTKKSADTRKAERFFKERGIRFQYVNLDEKGLSKGELASVKQAVGGLDAMIDENAKDKNALALLKYIADEDKEEKLLECQQLLKQPIVRNGKKATVGYQPDVWKAWE